MPDTVLKGGVKRLRLSHFRSYEHLSISPEKPLITLAGPNGAGKTNVLEAVSMLAPGRGLRQISSPDMIRAPADIGWKIHAEAVPDLDPVEIETGLENSFASRRFIKIDGKPHGQAALGKFLRILWLTPAMDRLWIEGATERRRFLDRMTLSFNPEHAATSTRYDKAMRERTRLLKEPGWDTRWLDALEDTMAISGADVATARIHTIKRLIEAQENAQTIFPAAHLMLQQPDGADASFNAEDYRQALAVNRNRDAAAGRALTGPHRVDMVATYSEKNRSAKHCSTGEQKALLISLILANARALREDIGYAPILLLDEIAAHLDPVRRNCLFDELEKLQSQVWMTGASEDIFTDLAGRASQISVSEIDARSQCAIIE